MFSFKVMLISLNAHTERNIQNRLVEVLPQEVGGYKEIKCIIRKWRL